MSKELKRPRIEEEEKEKKEENDAPPAPKTTRSVYVQGIPETITIDTMESFFKRAGVIKEYPETGLPFIKIYRDKDTGDVKGDGLVTYLHEASVGLACKFLDGSEIESGHVVTVQPAKFEAKPESSKEPAPKKKRSKALEGYQKLQLSWSEGDEEKKLPRVVVLHHMFDPKQFLEDDSLKDEIEKDVKQECSRFGEVHFIKIFEYNPEGVLSVKFATHDAAKQCIRVMNGRYFDKRQISAHFWDGTTKYNQIDEAVEAQRLDNFADWLENGDD